MPSYNKKRQIMPFFRPEMLADADVNHPRRSTELRPRLEQIKA